MPNPLNTVTVPDAYTDACSIQELYGARGGSFAIADAAVYYQLQYGRQGMEFWTDEAIIQPGGGSIEPGAIGVRFRNAVAGVVATASARLSPPNQPGLTLGFAAAAASTMLTGIIPLAGTTPTAGTGFTYTHAAGSGTYVFTWTTAFTATPVVLATPLKASNSLNTTAVVEAATSTGATIVIRDQTGVKADGAFNFVALEAV